MRSYIPPATPDLYPDVNSTSIAPIDIDPYSTTLAPATKDASLLATLPDFRVFGRLFDVMFVLAALSTMVWRYIGNKLNGPDEFGTVYHH
jgi:hypothetical protein